MTGVITGSWSYVWAAYIVTWVFFGGYTVSILLRGFGNSGPTDPNPTTNPQEPS